MKTQYSHFLFTFVILTSSFFVSGQNVAINTTGTAGNTSAGLDVDFTNKGLLIPRIVLSATNVAAPVTTPATSLLVYNTATAGTAPNNVVPGYYYWNGTTWIKLFAEGDAWKLLGNTGTNAANQFIGTTDLVDFVVRTNNTERVRVTRTGAVNIWSGGNYAIPNNFMAPGSLTIGSTTANFGGGSGWTTNTAGLLMEALDNTEIAVHDFGSRIASLSYYEAATNRISIGRDMGWGAISTIGLYGNVGVGTITPGVRLDVNGTARVLDVFAAGGQNLIIGDDSFLTDVDLGSSLGLRSTSNNYCHLVSGTTNQAMFSGGTENYVHGAGTQTFGVGGQYMFAASHTQATAVSGETGGIFADGNAVAIWSPGDANGGQPAALVYFMDEDSWDAANTNPYDNTALKSYINTAGALVTVSDARKKNNIKPVNRVLDRLTKINGYEYYFNLAPEEIQKGQKANLQSGYLAQELMQQFPTAVEQSEQGDLFVNYSAMIPYLTVAIKEQQSEIELLKAEVEALKLLLLQQLEQQK